ncbi:MAG: DNA repair protein RecN [Deltaproteobacteria bacterium]|nr:DNA repair protein RecN [Deltaproteobacteria bacterium]
MLTHLQIKNLVLIEDLSISFDAGFNVLTGETGAGKSLITTSLDLLLGKRAKGGLVRKDAEEAEVEGIFDISDEKEVMIRLEEAGIPVDEELLIRRVIPVQGRHKVFLNGKLASLGVLSGIAENLAQLMGQHEQQLLFDSRSQLNLIDEYADKKEILTEMLNAFESLQNAEKRLHDLKQKESDRTKRLDYLEFQLEELERLSPVKGEFLNIHKSIEIEKHQTELLETTSDCSLNLYENDGSIFENIGSLSRDLEHLSRIDPVFAEYAAALNDAAAIIEDTARNISSYSRNLDADPNKLEELMERESQLLDLSRKHGVEPDDLDEFLEKLRDEHTTLKGFEESFEKLLHKVEECKESAYSVAVNLSKVRSGAALKMSKSVTKELKDLNFADGSFKVIITSKDEFLSKTGMDRVEFMVELNKGEGYHPLKKVASGGELSRMMLAIKRAFAGVGPVGTYVFDEVDAGIGGNTANSVAAKLKEVAKHHQLICITHLPQIAAFADRHFFLSKNEKDKRTVTTVTELSKSLVVSEIARMLGGDSKSKKMEDAAKDLLKFAQGK